MNTIPSPKELREEWAAALESGKFEQGRGALCKETDGTARYCCLGVGCEILRKYVKIDKVPVVDTVTKYSYQCKNEIDRNDSPYSLDEYKCKLLGISADIQNELVYMNDSARKTLQQIATYIRCLPE